MTIRTGEVVPGSESPVGIGLSGAVRCTLRTGGALESVILKRQPLPKVLAEVFCAVLLRGWRIPVPEPFLVKELGGLAFASAEASYPNLAQRLGIESFAEGSPEHAQAARTAAAIAVSLPSTPSALAADEAIDNRDRNLQNVLWDGEKELWIDHENALGNGNHMADANKLCMMAEALGRSGDLSQAAITAWTLLARTEPEAARDLLAAHADVSEQADFVAQRLAGLGQMIYYRAHDRRYQHHAPVEAPVLGAGFRHRGAHHGGRHLPPLCRVADGPNPA